jgi:predicted O-methyltransferase YrrM
MNQAGFTPIVAQPRRWDVIESFMKEQGYKNFIEVGCKEGRTTGHVLKTVPEARAVAIDPWMVQTAASADAETYDKWNFAQIEAEFWTNVGDAKDRCQMIRKTSAEAADIIVGPFDLVFIDARHDYDSVLEDIHLWWPKIRLGGMICGHDFNHKWPGVERAVAQSFNLMHVGVASDSVWFVIKQTDDQLRAPKVNA